MTETQNTADRQWELIREALPWREYGMEPPGEGDWSLNEVLAAFDALRARYERMEEVVEAARAYRKRHSIETTRPLDQALAALDEEDGDA
jgi:hypothetical protein